MMLIQTCALHHIQMLCSDTIHACDSVAYMYVSIHKCYSTGGHSGVYTSDTALVDVHK